MVTVNHGGTTFRGQSLHEPIRTITMKHGYGVVTPQLTNSGEIAAQFIPKYYKSGTGQTMYEPIHTITTSPGHFGLASCELIPFSLIKRIQEDKSFGELCDSVSSFLIKYSGIPKEKLPIQTILTPYGKVMVTVVKNQYVLSDIYLRMLEPEELKRGQGFPNDYIISHTIRDDRTWEVYSKKEQCARIGNSVVPLMATLLAGINCPYLKIKKRVPMPNVAFDEPAGERWKELA